MVTLSTVRATNAQLGSLNNPTTAAFVGGTSGIGRATLLALARRKTNVLKVYIFERNAASHQPLLDELKTVNKNGQFIFLEARVSLLKDIKKVCEKIKEKEAALTCSETPEGLSLHHVLAFWSRALFTSLLLPLLKASQNSPRVVTILRAGKENPNLDLEDLDCKKAASNSALTDRYAAAVETLTTLYFEHLATGNPGIVFIHKYPGLAKTDIFASAFEASSSWSLKRAVFRYVVPPLVGAFGISEEEVGERGVFILFGAGYGGKGVEGPDGLAKQKNSKKGFKGEGVFMLKQDDEAVENEKALEKLRGAGPVERVVEETENVLQTFL
ncbi:hypothetical protein BCR34DRAFT_675602 [Clohesyomyces aquaticus]|uniref:NAD(P)-binding protein n=1 Tax=Clohesyomyces aquaticus TaxID=1231657 RepID=A0A1Y1Z6G6_9PLEO|nr:hypothetical protein BCR34DRAFT_675602 [Clohesyomyces aquaticus]